MNCQNVPTQPHHNTASANEDRDSNAHEYPDANSHGDGAADCHGDPDPHTDDCNRDADHHADGDRDGDGCPDGDCNRDTDHHASSDRDGSRDDTPTPKPTGCGNAVQERARIEMATSIPTTAVEHLHAGARRAAPIADPDCLVAAQADPVSESAGREAEAAVGKIASATSQGAFGDR